MLSSPSANHSSWMASTRSLSLPSEPRNCARRRGPTLGFARRALGFTKDETALLNYWEPNKLQRAEPTDGISVGVKFKVSNLFEAGIYRYWIVEEKATGIEAWTWIKDARSSTG